MMDRKKKLEQDIAQRAGTLAGDMISQNVQAGSNIAIDSMSELLYKAGKLSNVGFEQSKGNLFEYIEAAKLQSNMANKGHFFDKNPVTDIPENRGGFGGHTAPDDFRMQKNGQVIGRGQAKYNNSPLKAARNFVDPKYTNMQRLAPIDQVKDIQSSLDKMLANGEISRNAYENAIQGLQTNGLTDPDSGISSGGTTTAEIQKLQGTDGKLSEEAIKKYAITFEGKQLVKEVETTSINMAALSAVSTGIVSGVQNMFAVFQNKKELDEALRDIGADTAKGAVKGAGTGLFSSLIRFGGTKAQIPILADSTAATVMAGGVIDGGVAIYAYAKGEITEEQLKQDLIDTTAKSTATIYFTKAVNAVVGTANPFLPMAIYTAASYIVSCTRAIIGQAELNAAEYNRMTALLQESTKLVKEYHEKLNTNMKYYEQKQRQILQEFMHNFEYNVENEDHYEQAIYSIINFANQTGIALQHANFNDFQAAMKSNDDFILR